MTNIFINIKLNLKPNKIKSNKKKKKKLIN